MFEGSTGSVFAGELITEQRGHAQQAAVVVVGCYELQAAFRRGEDDGGIAAETGGGGETQDACARFGVVGSGEQPGEG
jgi:hypothetical protein